ncbi:MAG TPA: transcription elongation factor GreA [Bacilli bacterium]|nr:MAG: Transcription elongation factor GreA [Tenericutes bacterium ADurb.BinA124]HPX84894.1 transcription elongation factor GreA [Bacilli bacterium]HQC74561.1 transcription elongation factor GreA [Bacilli bacterium]
MNGKHQLTAEGLDKCKAELDFLKSAERGRVIESLKEARAQGDLSENADYDAARDEQARLEARIKELENIIKNAVIIDDNKTATSNLGKKIIVEFEDKTIYDFVLVGSLEADPLQEKISNESPLGMAIINHKVGDRVLVKTETGNEFYVTIKKIS